MLHVESVHEMPNFGGSSGSVSERETSVPSMPFFEVSQKNDRPFAPSADDYPLGCEVELRDVEYAKAAQELAHWEPFLDDVFSSPRRRATVKRHLGDYTFVVCTDVKGIEKIGMTLYRACLSEPKVTTTKFFADVAMRKDAPNGTSESDENAGASEQNGHGFEYNLRGQAFPRTNFYGQLVSAKKGEADGTNESHLVLPPEIAQRTPEQQLVYWMKKGTYCIEKKGYKQALEYYNKALETPAADKVRVYSSRCVAFSYLNMYREAQEDARRVIDLLPNEYIGYVRMGSVLHAFNNYADAQGFYREALARDRNNLQIRALLMSNSVSMIFEYRTKRNENLKVRFDVETSCALALAKNKIKRDEIILKETSSLVTVMGSGYVKSSKDAKKKSAICQYCGSIFVDPDTLCKDVKGLSKSLFCTLYAKPEPVKCQHNCSYVYCTDECRSKHWSESHWLECPARGRWKSGLHKMHQYLDEYAAQHVEEDRLFPPALTPLEDKRSCVVVACVRTVARMIFRMIGCAFPLAEAVHMYEWLCISPSVDVPLHVEYVLHKSLDLLSPELSKQQKELLNVDLFKLLYRRVKSNAIYITLSVWPEIRQRAETHMKLLESVSSSIEINASNTDSTNANNEALRQIMHLPPWGPEGTFFNAIAVFDLYALTAGVNMSMFPITRRKVNAKVVSTLVSNFRIRIKCIADVRKDEAFVCAPLDPTIAP
ncbi:hypothetical protein STCU_08615 [Strigomonas culicis]|uniref:Uncharacterized protein n=1 Tax=Strigomonas culicis TaxID=28005 RepID=S9VDX8_9TRYP|nr:hypothetical protein STCU_08615 [Strigomonas culicis]|eukprot:EPY21285.1 hypothetical protein STCU_08615 [Strigomonas culicis]